MSKRIVPLVALSVSLGAIAALGGLSACGGGGYGGDNGSGGADVTAAQALGDSADATQALGEATRGVVASATALAGSASKRTITASCARGGSAVLNGTLTGIGGSPAQDADVSGTLVLADCNGYSGSLDLTGSVSGTTGHFTAVATVNGEVEGMCSVRTDSLTFNVTGAGSSAEDASAAVSGSLLAYCGNATVTCSWSNVSVDDTAALEAGCSATE